MTTPFYLIDFENVQPKALGRLVPGTSRIKVFLGQNQTKLMLDLVQALQPFGENAQYIQISGTGPDAVDFHIAFYVGRLAADHPGASFTIVSKDKGFDPLVRHLASLGIACRRLPEIPEVAAPVVAVAKPASASAPRTAPAKAVPAPTKTAPSPAASTAAAKHNTKTRVAEVVARLKKSTKPANLSTLRSSIKSWFTPPLQENALNAVVQSLRTSGTIVVVGTKVSYNLG